MLVVPEAASRRGWCARDTAATSTTTVIRRQDTVERVVEPGAADRCRDGGASRVTLGRIVVLMLEVITGRRPGRQLATVTEAQVRRYLRAARPTALARPLVLVSVRVCVPAEQVAELAAVLGYGQRTPAMAARFEQGGDGWRCVTFRIL